jgi:membrane protein DedA with SNARE-associated domain
VANALLDWVASLGGVVLYLVIFLLAFGESAALVDLVVPGEAGMIVAGAAVAAADLPLWLAIGVATLGAVLGDSLSYTVGRRWGLRVIDKWAFTRKHLGKHVEPTKRHFERHGILTVSVSRWVGALRAVAPLLAGTSDMHYGKFLAANFLGAVTWAAAVVSLGYFLGGDIADLVDRFALAISVVVVVGLALFFGIRWWRRRGRDPQGEESDREYAARDR